MGFFRTKRSNSASPDEDELLALARQAAKGRGLETRRLLEALGPSVTRTVRHVLGAGHPDLDDVLQETLMKILRSLPAFRGESRVSHFASCIAFRCALQTKRRAREVGQWMGAYHQMQQAEPASSLPSDETTSERRRRLLAELLAGLPDAQAETLGLRFFLGLSIDEVASLTGAPANTVRSRLRLAKQTLLTEMQNSERWAELKEFAS